MLVTVAPTKRILARATVPEDFPRPFAISDLSRFLGAFTLLEKPHITFGERQITLTDHGESLVYGYGDESSIVAPPSRTLELPRPIVTIKLAAPALKNLMKAAATLKQPELAIVGDEAGDLYVQTLNTKKPTMDTFSIKVEGEATTFPFRLIFRADNLKLIDADYTVAAALEFSQWTSPGLEYLIAVEEGSKADADESE